jgi:hypothetical protein
MLQLPTQPVAVWRLHTLLLLLLLLWNKMATAWYWGALPLPARGSS